MVTRYSCLKVRRLSFLIESMEHRLHMKIMLNLAFLHYFTFIAFNLFINLITCYCFHIFQFQSKKIDLIIKIIQ